MARLKLAKELAQRNRPGSTSDVKPSDSLDLQVDDSSTPRLLSSEDEIQESSSEDEDGDEAWDALMDTTPVEPAKGYTGHGPFPYLSGRLADAKPATFAQPVVFHDITCLARLARSNGAKHVTSLRLRCPGRDVVKTLSESSSPSETPNDVRGRKWFPRLRYLDVSTSNVRMDGYLPTLLRRYAALEHLVLDRTNLFGFRGKDGGKELCADLARLISGLSGIQRSKERERELLKFDEDARRKRAIGERDRLRRLRVELQQQQQQQQTINQRDENGSAGDEEDEIEYDEDGEIIVRPPPTTSSRPEHELEPEPITYRPAQRAQPRRNRRTIAVSSFSVRDNTRRNRAHDRVEQQDDLDLIIPPSDTISIVLPALSRIKSINLGGEALPLDQKKLDAWDRGFRAGWKDGLDKAYEWANRTGERYDRAIKAAESWRSAEQLEFMRTGGKSTTKPGGSKGGNKRTEPSPLLMPNGKPRTKPPLDVRLYRYPWPEEQLDEEHDLDLEDPFAGLIRVGTDENWKEVYLRLLGEAEARCAADTVVKQDVSASAHIPIDTTSTSGPILCCIPDCEGPMRKGDGGERVDGRGGMKIVNGQVLVRGGFKHKPGCGHEHGTMVWTKMA
jgi:hypothetical protein